MSDEQIERAKITMIFRAYMAMFVTNVSLFFSNLYSWCVNASKKLLKWFGYSVLAVIGLVIIAMTVYAIYMIRTHGGDGAAILIQHNIHVLTAPPAM